MPSCRRLPSHTARCADNFPFAKTGSSIAARIAMMAMTTSNSISVKADFDFRFSISFAKQSGQKQSARDSDDGGNGGKWSHQQLPALQENDSPHCGQILIRVVASEFMARAEMRSLGRSNQKVQDESDAPEVPCLRPRAGPVAQNKNWRPRKKLFRCELLEFPPSPAAISKSKFVRAPARDEIRTARESEFPARICARRPI